MEPSIETANQTGMTHAAVKMTTSQGLRKRVRIQEKVIHALLFLCASVSVLTTAAIVLTLVIESMGFFKQVSVWEFLTGTVWTPLFKNQSFGVLPLVSATLLTTLIAMLVAGPMGLIIAVYLSEYASPKMRRTVKPLLEILAGIPTVVYGYFALLFVTPVLKSFIPGLEGFNALAPGIVMGIMILPTVASLSEDAIYAVPNSLRYGSLSLGATRLQTIWGVVVPAAFSGISASFLLGISRAVGETMIVAIAAGNQPNLTFNPLVQVQTMTTYIAQVSKGDTPHGTVGYYTIFAVGLLLFLMTLILNIASYYIRKRYKEARL